MKPLVLLALFAFVPPAFGQEATPSPAPRTTTLAAGSRYKAGSLHEFFFGPHYRDLWASPIQVEVLDLATFAGGLKPVRKGGGLQTKTLRFDGADGREYRVRSVDKDPTRVLPPELQESTLVERLVQDQISAAHPAAPLVVDGLLEAAGLLHVEHRLVVLPDDPLLGEFRQEFAGLLGILEENPDPKNPLPSGWEGVRRIEETTTLWKIQDANPEERVDSRAFLKARLLDMLVGDWDRHKDNWEWARRGDRWLPVPEDRDQAFSRYDGLGLSLIRPSQPRLVNFGRSYPRIFGLTWQARYVDRRFLADLDWAAWEEVVRELRSQITDEVIEAAVRRLPDVYYRLDGRRLAAALKARREALPEAARAHYLILAEDVEVHGGDVDEVATVERAEDGTVEVTVSRLPRDGREARPYYRRRFRPAETDEVRIFLKGGHDRVVTRGRQTSGIEVRVIGGPGEDTLDDAAGGATRFYDSEGPSRVVEGPGTDVSDTPFVHPVDRGGNPERDWGSMFMFLPWVFAGGDLGVFAGAELHFTRYGFRKHPYGSRHVLSGGYSTALKTGRVEYEGEYRRSNSLHRGQLAARFSRVDIVHFHGFGNEVAAPEPADFYKVRMGRVLVAPAFTWGFPSLDVSLGLSADYATTDLADDRLIGRLRPFGTDEFGKVGPGLTVSLDRRDRPRAATRGFLLWASGNYYPPLWSVDSAFGEVHGEGSTYLSARLPLEPTLALRVGGKKLWGRYPFHEAAFIGGPDTVRGLRRQRYAGDAAAFGNAELRLRLFGHGIFVPGEVGVFGLADAGRVWLKGETSDRWHTGVGGGIWMSFLKRENVFTLAVAQGREGKARLYVGAGFAF